MKLADYFARGGCSTDLLEEFGLTDFPELLKRSCELEKELLIFLYFISIFFEFNIRPIIIF